MFPFFTCHFLSFPSEAVAVTCHVSFFGQLFWPWASFQQASWCTWSTRSPQMASAGPREIEVAELAEVFDSDSILTLLWNVHVLDLMSLCQHT
jgi:hypothetical protein